MTTETVRDLEESTLERVIDAHTRSVDALAGYKTMVREAEPGFRSTAERFRDLHKKHAEELAEIIKANGRDADDDGSYMAMVNRAVVKTRSIFDFIDTNVMKAIRDGEARVIEALQAVERERSPEPLVVTVRRMREELETLLRNAPAQNS
jgi:hypothetical protein